MKITSSRAAQATELGQGQAGQLNKTTYQEVKRWLRLELSGRVNSHDRSGAIPGTVKIKQNKATTK